MKVFYGVQGTGNGHISRARAMNAELKAAGVEVDFFFSGRRREDYFDMEEFGHWRSAKGLSFVAEKGTISLLKTVRQNNLWELWQDILNLDLSDYDRVICDFEPITAWAAKRQNVSCICLGHQYAFQHKIPIEGDSWLSQAIIKHFAPGAQQLGLHWHHFEQPILPPIVHLENTPSNDRLDSGDHSHISKDLGEVLVYLGFEDSDQVISLLRDFPTTKFVYYGNFDAPKTLDNIRLEPLSLSGFKRDLYFCRGVICNAGFELASEAIQLGKPILVKPLHGQMEQLSNALALQQLKLGSRMNSLSHGQIEQWLQTEQVNHYRYPNVAKAIVSWLLDPDSSSVPELARALWLNSERTFSPETTQAGF